MNNIIGKLMKMKLKDLTLKEFLSAFNEHWVCYTDITKECEFKSFCSGGSNDSKYGVDSTYWDLGIYYKNKLIFKLNINSFKEKSITEGSEYHIVSSYEEGFMFHWLDNGSFMIVKKIRSKIKTGED